MPNSPIIITAFANEYHNGRYLQSIKDEITGINTALKARKLNTFFEVVPIYGASIEAIRKTLADIDFKDRIIAFHYGGHADGDNLLLQTETGLPQLTPSQTLADFLSQQEHLQLVFLNGCATKGQVEKLKQADIPYIIATNRSIEDAEATRFAVQFYQALATGERNISTLFEAAKNALQNESLQKTTQRRLFSEESPLNNFSWGLYESENHTKSEKLGEWFVHQNRELLTTAPPPPPKAFIGRNTDLKEVHTLLEDNDNVVLVNGIGGIGKSTLAQAYWHKHQHQYSFLAWVTVVNDNLQESFLNSGLEQKLNIQIPEKSTIEERYQVLQRELSQIEGIKLLVLDNMNEPDLIHEFELPNWKVLLTSRAAIPHYLQHTVGILSKEDAIELFETYYPPAKEQTKLLEELLEGIGYHTLTIELLAKNLQQLHGKGYGLGDLCENLKEKGLLKPKKSRKIYTKYRKGGEVKYEKVISEMFDLNPLNEYAQWLLLQFAVLPAISISFQLMMEFLQITDKTEEEFDETLEKLVKRGWLEKGENGYRIHQVVQEVVREKIEPNGENCGVLVDILDSKIKLYTGANPLEKVIYLKYAYSLSTNFKGNNNIKVAHLMNNIASLYSVALGDFNQAISFQKKAIKVRESFPNHKNKDLATLYNNIGISYREIGNYEESLLCHKKGVNIHNEILDINSLYISKSFSNMGVVYYLSGDYEKALEYFHQSILIDENLPDTKELDLATVYNNVSIIYQDLKNYEKALFFQEKSIGIRKKILGAEHPDLITSYGNIALIYKDLGELEKALDIQNKVISIREKNFHSKHPSLGISYNNIASTYRKLGNYSKAKDFAYKCLEIDKENFSPFHPELAITYSNIAFIHYLSNEFLTAKNFIDKSINILKHNFPKGHPNLDKVLERQQKIEEALNNN